MTINPAYIPFAEWQRQRKIRASFKKFGAGLAQLNEAFRNFGETAEKAAKMITETQMKAWYER